jgi:hypothetical protein
MCPLCAGAEAPRARLVPVWLPSVTFTFLRTMLTLRFEAAKRCDVFRSTFRPVVARAYLGRYLACLVFISWMVQPCRAFGITSCGNLPRRSSNALTRAPVQSFLLKESLPPASAVAVKSRRRTSSNIMSLPIPDFLPFLPGTRTTPATTGDDLLIAKLKSVARSQTV